MKIKNNFLDKRIMKEFLRVLGIIELFLSVGLIFIEIPSNKKTTITIIFAILLILLYCYIWVLSNKMKNISLIINNSKVEIKFGNIFNTNGKKVITFNEYFDTCVDNEIINKESINGQFINKKVSDILECDRIIENKLKDRNKKGIKNNRRRKGKKEKFKLGTTIKYDEEFLLTAFTKFNSENCAELSMSEYINCLIELWNELDILYSQDVVVIPLLGSGVTRFKENILTEQEILELILWSFKISKIKFSYPSKLCIVISDSLEDKINLYRIKERY